MSSLNPFRNLAALTTSSSQSSASSSSALSPASTGTSVSSQATTAISDQSLSKPSASPDILDEELPPAYTPAADSRHGEHTVEYGPTRPFQNPSRPSPRHAQSTGWSTSQNLAVPDSQHASSRLGTHSSSQYNSASQSTWLQPNVPPPLPPRPNTTSPGSPTSEFARDFYTVGPGESETSRYPPPPGPPPSRPPPSSDDEGRPTTKPTPGRPLLNQGRLLVYPAGYECDKCTFTTLHHATCK